ncbi:hypothetical protein HYX16_01195 [Candidatus Woesearchaeota archaeon]|nr:hypothetical protein [Candidatus Woesearchaeota archaeon]
MEKRGQISVFAIVGVIIVAVIVLFLVVRNNIYFGSASIENLEKEFPPIQAHVEDCLEKVGKDFIYLIGRQGGYLTTNPGTYREYGGFGINYLCYNIGGKPQCRNRGLRLVDIENSLKKEMKDEVNSCLNINQFSKIGLDVSRGDLKLDIDIGDDNVLIDADLPVKISKGSVETERNDFFVSLNLPLGRLYNSAHDIVESEALNGNFETLTYSVLKTRVTNKPYIVQKLQPYPDKLYVLKIKDVPDSINEFVFQFFVEDEPL